MDAHADALNDNLPFPAPLDDNQQEELPVTDPMPQMEILKGRVKFHEVASKQIVNPCSLESYWPKLLPFCQLGTPPTRDDSSLMACQKLKEIYWELMDDPVFLGDMDGKLSSPFRGVTVLTSYRNAHLPYPTYQEVCGFDAYTPSQACLNFFSCARSHFRVTGLYTEVLTLQCSYCNLDEDARVDRQQFLLEDIWRMCPNLKAVCLSGHWTDKIETLPAPSTYKVEKIDLVVIEFGAIDLIAANTVAGPLRNTTKLEAPQQVLAALGNLHSSHPMLTLLKLNGLSADTLQSLLPFFEACPNLESLEMCACDVPTPSVLPAFINNVISLTKLRHLAMDESFFVCLPKDKDNIIVIHALTSVHLKWRSMNAYNREILELLILASNIDIEVINHGQSIEEIKDYAASVLDPLTQLSVKYA